MGDNYYNLRSKKNLENQLNTTNINDDSQLNISNNLNISNETTIENHNLSIEEIEEIETNSFIHSIVDSIFEEFINDVQSFTIDKSINLKLDKTQNLTDSSNQIIIKNLTERNNISLTSMAFDKKWAFKVIPEFTGEDSKLVNKFISCCDVIYEPLTTKEEQSAFLKFLSTKLDKEAYDLIHFNKFESWNDLKREIQKRFGETRSVHCIQNEMRNASQGHNDNVVKFGNLIEKLLLDLNNACIINDGEVAAVHFQKYNKQLAIQSFENGIKDSRISLLIKACRFNELKDAVAKAIEEEQNLQLKNKNLHNNTFPVKCQNCDKIGHTSRTCRFNLNVPRQNYQGVSYHGHKSSQNSNQSSSNNNFQNSYNQNNSNFSQNRNNNQKSIRTFNIFCNYCRKYGHSISECYRANRHVEQPPSESNLTSKNDNIENNISENFEGLDLNQSKNQMGTSSRVQTLKDCPLKN